MMKITNVKNKISPSTSARAAKINADIERQKAERNKLQSERSKIETEINRETDPTKKQFLLSRLITIEHLLARPL